MALNPLKAQMLLSECTGDDIWSEDYCREKGVPEVWVNELIDAYESGFSHHSQTIYYQGDVVNQFEGVRDVDLATKLAEYLGVDTSRIVPAATSRSALVVSLKEAVEEG